MTCIWAICLIIYYKLFIISFIRSDHKSVEQSKNKSSNKFQKYLAPCCTIYSIYIYEYNCFMIIKPSHIHPKLGLCHVFLACWPLLYYHLVIDFFKHVLLLLDCLLRVEGLDWVKQSLSQENVLQSLNDTHYISTVVPITQLGHAPELMCKRPVINFHFWMKSCHIQNKFF